MEKEENRIERLIQIRRRVLVCLVEYKGSNFCGWQKQPHSNTVQSAIEQAFETASGCKVVVVASGRTDTGVHSTGQVFHVDLDESFLIPIHKVCLALNGALDSNIRLIQAVELHDTDFHARFSAIARTYQYKIAKHESVFSREFAWCVYHHLEVEVMNAACKEIVGTHDFTSFSKHNKDTSHSVCTVYSCNVQATEQDLLFTIKANRFVYSMVRALVGAIVKVGKGESTLNDFKKKLLETNRDTPFSVLAPPSGLYLAHIEYPEKYALNFSP